MQNSIETITSELIKLPRKERLEIVRFLLFLDNCQNISEDVDQIWEKEISERVRAVENGTAEYMDFDTAMDTINHRYKT